MLGELVAFGLGSAGTAFILFRAIAPSRRIWRGDASATIDLPTRFGRVKARNYLAYLCWAVPAAGGLLIISGTLFIAILFRLEGPAGHKIVLNLALAGLVLLMAAFPMALIHVAVNATGRPRFLVPPPYRAQPGAFTAWRRRRARRRARRPPTDHPVEIIEVPDDETDESFLVAICADAECNWVEQSDSALGAADAERALRRLAARHTSNVVPGIRRPLSRE